MHICHVITRLIVGGAQENTVLTCRGLIERGHRVTLIAGPETGPEGSLWSDASQTGCELIEVEALRRAVHPLRDWRATRDLGRIFEEIRPDVVHTHSSKAGIVARFAAARAGVPAIVHTIHGMSFNRTQTAPTRWLYRTLERRAARCTTAFVSVADAMTDQAVAAGLAPRDRFTTIRSGMRTDQFEPRPEARRRYRNTWKVGPDDVVVGTIARLFENKGYEEIIDALPTAVAREPRLRFVWVGDGLHRRRYERQLESLGLDDRVHLCGLVQPEEVPLLISGFDMVVHASRWEGLPRTVVQGLLCEVPAISFDNDGAPEVVIPNETGILLPYGDTQGLARAVVELARDAARRNALGKRGRARCLEMFDWRVMAEQLDALYARVAPSRSTVV
jgi:glycosyltransferase involved in cell wall biosynthesis